MYIKELTLPANEKKITYEINKNGETHVYISLKKTEQKTKEWDLSKIHLGQLNSIHMTQQNQLQNILEKNPYEQEKKQKQNKKQSTQNKEVTCSCKKTKCLKMYCECFAKKLFCSPNCGCKGCTNTQVNAKKIMFIREELDEKRQTEEKGCKCTKSGCNKKYCYCYSNNKRCGQFCICSNCENFALPQQRVMKQ